MAPTTRRLDRRIQGGIKRQFPEGIDVPLPEGTSPANHRGPARPPISPLLSVQPGWETYPGYPGESRPRLPHSKLGLPPDNRCDRCRRGNKLNPLVKPSTRIRRDIGVKLGVWGSEGGVCVCVSLGSLGPFWGSVSPLRFHPPPPSLSHQPPEFPRSSRSGSCKKSPFLVV